MTLTKQVNFFYSQFIKVAATRKIKKDACRREIPKKLLAIAQKKFNCREKKRLARYKELDPFP
jgi:hypothetical protein